MLQVNQVSKRYSINKTEQYLALDQVSFTLADSGCTFIIGKSGSGKSTLLNIMSGLDSFDQGEITVAGKSLKEMSEHERDAYRNTYIGFVFQEFHLLEEFTVYENVALALELQKEKKVQVAVSSALAKVGLQGYEKRQINELSGGEQQRVAIARALVKNPKILFADEPTGNLDSQTSEQILSLLKQLSREMLVVIVSHDLESAQRFQDHLIEIADGKIIYDNQPNSTMIEEVKPLISSHLPFHYTFKIAVSMFRYKKKRWIGTTISMAIALCLVGLVVMLLSQNEVSLNLNETSMKDALESKLYTQKYFDDGSYNEYVLSDEKSLSQAQQELSLPVFAEQRVYDNGTVVETACAPIKVYYKTQYEYVLEDVCSKMTITEIDDRWNQIYLKNIKGTLPTLANEIIITSVRADAWMNYGVEIIQEDGTVTFYYPKTVEELLQSRKKIKFGKDTLIVSGVLPIEKSYFQILKKTYGTLTDADVELAELYQFDHPEFSRIYVGKDFFNSLTIKKQTKLPKSSGSGKIENPKTGDSYYLNSNNGSAQLDKEITIFDGTEVKTIHHLEDNEILINTTFLKNHAKGNFDKLLQEYVHSEKEKQPLLSEEELKFMFIQQYINHHNLLYENCTVTYMGFVGKKEFIEKKYENMNVIGYVIDPNDTEPVYIPNRIMEDFSVPSHLVESNFIPILTKENLKKAITTYPYQDGVVAKTYLSDDVHATISVRNVLKIGLLVVGSIFFAFAFSLLVTFIGISISYKKKQIGILRALGAKASEVFKVFFIESFFINMISLILSIPGCLGLVKVGNMLFATTDYFSVPIFHYNWITLVVLLLIVFVGTLLSVSFFLRKIFKSEPITMIKNA